MRVASVPPTRRAGLKKAGILVSIARLSALTVRRRYWSDESCIRGVMKFWSIACFLSRFPLCSFHSPVALCLCRLETTGLARLARSLLL